MQTRHSTNEQTGSHRKTYLIEMAGVIVLYIFLQFCCQYYWYAVGESNGLFLYNCDYFLRSLARPAGLLAYAGAFLAQFCVLEYAGALLFTILCYAVYKSAQVLNERLMPTFRQPFFALLLVAYTILLHIDADYHISGTLALIGSMLLLISYLRLDSDKAKAIFVWVIIPICGWLMGPAIIVVALCIIIIEFSADTRMLWFYLLAVPAAALPLTYMYVQTDAETAQLTYLPDTYFYHYISPGVKVWYPWIVVVVMVAILSTFNTIKVRFNISKKILPLLTLINVVAVVIVFVVLFAVAYNARVYDYLKVDHLRKTAQWDKLAAMKMSERTPSMAVNTYNLALQMQGLFGEKVFIARRLGPGSLYTPYAGQPMLADLLSDIYFSQGNIAMSQKMAMNYMLSREDGLDGRALLRLIDTNLLLGNERVAEKYIGILEDTWHYKDEATARKTFLTDKTALGKDARLGELSRCVPADTAVITSVVADLETILGANPDFKPAREFLDIYNRLLDEYNKTNE